MAADGSVSVERPPDLIGEVLRRGRLEREIAGGLLGRDLDMGVGGDQFLRNRNPLDDLDALPDQRVISRCSSRPSPPRSKPF